MRRCAKRSGSMARRSSTSCRSAAKPASVKRHAALSPCSAPPASRGPAWSALRAGFRLVAALAAAPGTQEDAVRHKRVLAEMPAQFATQQVALGRGERGGGAVGSAAHALVVAGCLTIRDWVIRQAAQSLAAASMRGGTPPQAVA